MSRERNLVARREDELTRARCRQSYAALDTGDVSGQARARLRYVVCTAIGSEDPGSKIRSTAGSER
jgi:hypothetical protein